MIQSKTEAQLAQVARNGGSLIVDGSRFTDAQLAQIARNLSAGSFLQVCNSDKLTEQQMSHIARNGKVIFS